MSFISKHLVYLLWAFCVLISCSNPSEDINNKRITPSEVDLNGLESGDIILKRGFGKVSKMITQYLDEKIPISHCGIIICEIDSIYVVHSVAKGYAPKDGVQTILLIDFLKDCQADYFYVVRKKSAPESRKRFALKALEFSQQQIPFDHEANNQSKDEMSCTELIYWCQIESFGNSDLTSISFTDKQLFVFNGLLDTSKYQIVRHY
jgi:hypothetical protein